MRIVIDATQQADHITGTDRLARNILKELQKIDTENTYEIICTTGFDYIPSCIKSKNFKVIRRAKYSRLARIAMKPLLYARSQIVGMGDNNVVTMSFHNMGLVQGVKGRVIVCAYDLIPLLFSEVYFSNHAELSYYKANLKMVVRKADRYLSISNHTKRDLQQHLAVSADKITVIELAPDVSFLQQLKKNTLQVTQEKYVLPNFFILALGANEPRKNIVRLIDAHLQLPLKMQADYPLIIIGQEWHGAGFDLHKSQFVRYIGYVADEDLPNIYKMASIFVFPSLYEGCGLPILESMASGTPVLAANTSAIPETAGTAAEYFDPYKTEEIASSLRRVLEDEQLRKKLIMRGGKRVQALNWEKSACDIHKAIMSLS